MRISGWLVILVIIVGIAVSAHESGRALVIVAPRGFNQHEFTIPRDTFLAAGWQVTVGASSGETAVGEYGMRVPIDVHLSDVSGASFDAVLFVGGMGATACNRNAEAHRLIKEVAENHGVISGICSGALVLVFGGFMDGQTAAIDVHHFTAAQMAQFNVIRSEENVWVETALDGGHIIATATGPSFGVALTERIISAMGPATAPSD